MTVLGSAVHSWDFRTFISTSSCRREKALVPPALIRGTHEQQREEEEILIFCPDETFLRIWSWSTTLHVLNVKTSVNPASLCSPFCLPQHFLHSRWHIESWSFLSKASASLPGISPTCPPRIMGCRELSVWYYEHTGTRDSRLIIQPHLASIPPQKKWTTGLCCLVQDNSQTHTLNPEDWGIFPALSNIQF